MANEVSNGLHNAVPYHWEYADAAARTGATGFTAEDVGKWAHQADDHSFWLLTATTPTWAHIGGAVAATQIPYGVSDGQLGGNPHFIYNVAGGGGSGGQLYNEIIGAGGAALGGQADTGTGVDGEASGAGGIGVYGYANGSGGRGVWADSGATDATALAVSAPSGVTVPVFYAAINGVNQVTVSRYGRLQCLSTPPSSASDTGIAGEIAWDSGFLYICVAASTWKRVAIATW